MKILLVEDDEIIALTLLKILRDRHYIVDLATAGDLGWEYAKTYDYDLILLDIVIPKLNGIEFCKKLRKVGNLTPVLLLTAQNSSDKKVIGLDAVADDYVVNPFEISELLARIRVLMRRRNSLTAQILQWKKLSLNSNSHEVIYDNKILNLTPKEYRFLELFLRSGDRVLTREIILDSLWDVEEAPSENAIAAHIKDLRRKLKEVGADPNLIETVYGVGYRLKPLPNSPAEQNQVDENKARVRQKTTKALEGVWHKYEITYNERMAILEQANLAWQEGNLKGELLQQAQWAAHKLAGGLGVFGFARGSHLALVMEQLLNIELAGDRNRQFSELLTALKKSLKPNFKSQLNPVNRNRPVMLIVDNHPELEQQLTSQMTDAGMVFELVTDSKSFQKVLQTKVDAVVWSFSLADATVETLDDFSSIINQKLPLPVILFTDNNDRDNRF
ncbi:MAG: response regulator, partial [Pleurocapsa sp.]